jgi:iron(III) transport system permease protein
MIATGMTLIAVPLGALLAFVMERTDLPFKRWFEPLILVPSFVSPMVLSFGFVVAAGRSGFYTVWVQEMFGGAPWGLYSITAMAIIAGSPTCPTSTSTPRRRLKNLGSDVEEAARAPAHRPSRGDRGEPAAHHALDALRRGAGVLPRLRALRAPAGPGRSRRPPGALDVPLQAHQQARARPRTTSWPRSRCASWRSPSRWCCCKSKLLQGARKYATVKGKAGRDEGAAAGKWTWLALALLAFYLIITVIVPISGITLRAFVTNWGFGVNLTEVLTLDSFRAVWKRPRTSARS